MNARARFSVLFTLLGVSMAAASVSYTWPLLVLLAWFGGSFVVVGIAYAAASSRLFGKRPNGTFSPYASVLLAPYLSLTWLIWAIQRLLSKEPCCNQVQPGL